jgi:hypothetical protein
VVARCAPELASSWGPHLGLTLLKNATWKKKKKNSEFSRTKSGMEILFTIHFFFFSFSQRASGSGTSPEGV